MDRTADIRIPEESKFRELEDEYLEKQARIWLSEVLKRRLDEDQTISDILADGDLLFDVAHVLWKLLIEKGVEVEDLRIFSRTRKSKKRSGKYAPYSNVDAFLKICKLMGLNGVDLFSPSDVVERRGARKVCLCIRSLSKKARSMDINVPDFDIVTSTITMPTKLISCIRRSLELSQCGSLSSDSYSFIDSDPLSMKTKSTASRASSYDLYSEESDDADSSVSVGYYRLSSKIHFETALLRKSDSSSSLESFSLAKNNNLEEALAHFGVHYHEMDKHELISSPSVNSSESVVDISALSCITNKLKRADSEYHKGCLTENQHNGDQTVIADGVHELDMTYYSSNQPTNLHDFDLDDDTHNEDDQGPVESQFGSLPNPMPNVVNTCGKVHKNSCDVGRELIVYSDPLEPKMSEETDICVSCHDYQWYASGSKDNETSDCVHLSSPMASDFGDGEAVSSYGLEDWSVDNEDLENVHLSIIERFLTTTICAKSEPSFCSEKCDESDCWNPDVDVSDVDLKSILPISSCEQFLHFVDGSSRDTKFVEDLSLVGADEGNGIIGFPNCAHQANFVQSTKQTTYGNNSPDEQEAFDKVQIQCSTNDKEFDVAKSPLSHTPLETFDADLDVEECVEATIIEAEFLVLKDHETVKLNQSKTRKSPLLKSIMGGAALLGVLALFLNIRTGERDKSKKPDSEPSHISRENKLSSHKPNTIVAKKGVYAAGKLKFS